MTLIEIKVEMGRVADALERIEFLLERLAYPPSSPQAPVQQATLDDLHIVTPEDHQRMAEEQQAFAERHQVVPGSPAMAQALIDWEEAQRNLYGNHWQAPQDWKAVFVAAERDRSGRTGAVPAPEAADAAPG